ncbi:MAG: PEP-CTERM sorting domain-containing protein [Planctomycetota bacterium]
MPSSLIRKAWLIAVLAGVFGTGSAWAAGQQAAVTFETVAPGTMFGVSFGQNPGDAVFTESGIVVSVDTFLNEANSTSFRNFEIGGFASQFFDTTPVSFGNVLMGLDFSALPFSTRRVSIDFEDTGGIENIGVNGEVVRTEFSPTNFPRPDFPELPDSLAGVVIHVLPRDTPGDSFGYFNGTLVFTGDIQSIQIGGQQLGIDNIIATDVPEPATLTVLTLGLVVMRRRRCG